MNKKIKLSSCSIDLKLRMRWSVGRRFECWHHPNYVTEKMGVKTRSFGKVICYFSCMDV